MVNAKLLKSDQPCVGRKKVYFLYCDVKAFCCAFDHNN